MSTLSPLTALATLSIMPSVSALSMPRKCQHLQSLWLIFHAIQDSLQFFLLFYYSSKLRISIIQQSYGVAITSTELCELA